MSSTHYSIRSEKYKTLLQVTLMISGYCIECVGDCIRSNAFNVRDDVIVASKLELDGVEWFFK
jgi:hypothetical protein